ncbi:C-terminal processing protease CtpA/Prc, contains a PDZ domain [Tenacibaculum sp. 190524A02b]|uniref:Carboxyl-terminal processing protease n=1 Tax=Tenacibaculum vairaonense TaxID=3137860 RepID=A0ABP1F527_9FLAO
MKKHFLLYLLSIALLLNSCSKDNNSLQGDVNTQINSFIWKGLNNYYLWQSSVPDLSDRKFSTTQQLNNFLNDFNDPNNLFESLLYQKETVDKWSWIVDDYIALEQALQGTTKTTGMEFIILNYINDDSKAFGIVTYVLPNTDAATKGVKRGMIFTEVNGTQITKQNKNKLLYSSNQSYTIRLADYNSGNPITNSTTFNLTKNSFTENPIHIAKTINDNGKKIGYLMYNSFTSNFDTQLNQTFAQFKTDAVTDLIIDLRYNPGGAVSTAINLASMVTGQFTGDVFAKERWNEKYMRVVDPNSLINTFPNKIDTEAINSLNLTNIYFITTDNSASASELIINGLKPHINVKTVGTKTSGKYVGSVTLYDSPNLGREGANPNHKWAMQPIVLEIVNKNNFNDKDGIEPDVELKENYGNLGILGDINEPLLKRTLEFINTGSKSIHYKQSHIIEHTTIGSSKSNNPTYNNMYVDLN